MIRDFSHRDYATLEGWANRRGMPAPPVAMLPEVGLVCEDRGEIQGAMWVYHDRFAHVAFPHWLVTDPNLGLKRSREAVGELFDEVNAVARREGIHTLITTVHEEGLKREAINTFGWQYLGEGATLYMPCRS